MKGYNFGMCKFFERAKRCLFVSFMLALPVTAISAGGPGAGNSRLSLDADAWPDVVPETWSDAPKREWPRSVRVQNVNGRPQFTADGKPVYALWGTVRWDKALRHSDAPLNFVTVWNSCRKWWPRGMEFDPAELNRLAEWHTRQYPEAMLVWDITIYPPGDWRTANPDELARDGDGRLISPANASARFSFASKKALEDMKTIVERVIRHLEGSRYANRIAGYRINSGHTAEWLGWDPPDDNTTVDFSPVAQRGFAAFAKKAYPELTDLSIPTLAERIRLDAPYSAIWDMPKHISTIAYHDYYSCAVADFALEMCRRAREIVGEHKLIGTYFGYVMTLMEYGNGHMRAHYSTKRFMDGVRGSVDFLMSPQAYESHNRGLGDTCVDMKPFASILDNGIMSVVEDDTRTYRNFALKSNGYSQGRTKAQTIAMLRRNMGISICRGMPFYTYAITSGMEFDYPEFAADAAQLRKFGQRALERGMTRNAEIALVFSEEAIKAMPDMRAAKPEILPLAVQWYGPDGKVRVRPEAAGRPLMADVYGRLCSRVARIGAPVDYRLAEDLADNPGNHKLYIFACCTRSTPALIRAAEALRKRDCTLVWTYAPGFVSRSGDPIANMRALTGMDLKRCEKEMDSKIVCPDGETHGAVGHPVTPLFRLDGQAETLGRYANGDCAFGAVKTGNAQSVFYGSYFLDLPALRKLAKRAGVHLYIDTTDPMEANDSFVTLHARFAGRKVICLPQRTSVYDVFNNRTVARGVREFSFDAPLHSSWLFYCADDAEISKNENNN